MTKAIKPKPTKPVKPYPDFPLFAHANGWWCKKIKGRFYYFGPWDDWQGALEKYQDQRDDLHAGRTPRAYRDRLTIRDLCNRFMGAKDIQRDAGEITPRTHADYLKTCGGIVGAFGKDRQVIDLASDDFEQLRKALAKTRGPNTLANEIQRIRTTFKYAYDAGLVDQPVRFGPVFKKPSKRILRAVRQDKGPLMFEADELFEIIEVANQPLKAMILLGINCGFGNADCGRLPKSAIDLKTGWVNFPRPKTAVPRRCPLWPETVEAIQDALEMRPKPKLPENRGLVFITKYGGAWAKNVTRNPITLMMRRRLDDQGIHRPGLGFYSLRRTFETIGGESKDQPAVDFIMGHVDETMSGVYRQRISDDRLVAVTDHVWNWLFAEDEEE